MEIKIKIPHFSLTSGSMLYVYNGKGIIHKEKLKRNKKYLHLLFERPLYLLSVTRTRFNNFRLNLFYVKKNSDNGVYICIPICSFHSYYTPYPKCLDIIAKVEKQYKLPEKLKNDIIFYCSLTH